MLSINKNYRSRQQVARSLPLHVIPSKDSFVLGEKDEEGAENNFDNMFRSCFDVWQTRSTA